MAGRLLFHRIPRANVPILLSTGSRFIPRANIPTYAGPPPPRSSHLLSPFSSAPAASAGVTGGGAGGGKQKKGRVQMLKSFYSNKLRDLLDHFNRISTAIGVVVACVGALVSLYSYLFIKDNLNEVIHAVEEMMPFFNKLEKFVRDEGGEGLTISWEEIAEIPVQIRTMRKQMEEIREILLENMKQKREGKEGGEQGKGKQKEG